MRYVPLDDPAQTVHPGIYDSAARTATPAVTPLFSSGGTENILMFLNITAGAAFTLTIQIEVQDPQTGTWVIYQNSFSAIATTGLKSYHVGIGAAATGNITGLANVRLPAQFRIQIVHGNANSVTYSLGAFCF